MKPFIVAKLRWSDYRVVRPLSRLPQSYVCIDQWVLCVLGSTCLGWASDWGAWLSALLTDGTGFTFWLSVVGVVGFLDRLRYFFFCPVFGAVCLLGSGWLAGTTLIVVTYRKRIGVGASVTWMHCCWVAGAVMLTSSRSRSTVVWIASWSAIHNGRWWALYNLLSWYPVKAFFDVSYIN